MTTTTHQQQTDESIDILVVEDNPGDVRLIREAFEMAETNNETELYVANTGKDAIAFLTQSDEFAAVPPPDLVLLDLNLPGRDGCEVLGTIRTDLQLRRLPVLMLTSSESTEDIERCYNARANAYLMKPTDPEEFISTAEAVERFWLEQAQLPPNAR
ncbi:response regulator [Natronococcus pandeyae]|uniref:Response regulator n=1 Tax=Natronococcus pandeyae TaxID=2055836 RepID=A0A8J8TSW4_9EURY|nr:response regulator [Natronococcus pandeyae]TYL39520.1 response regulator [Natronococcus pandeyae]